MNLGRKMGSKSLSRYGQGQPVENPVQPLRVPFSSFRGGLDLRDVRNETDPASSPNCFDIEVTAQDELTRGPGVLEIEEFEERMPTQMAVHTSLDYSAELLLFDAPFLGIKRIGPTVWSDEGLPRSTKRWASVVFGEHILFTNQVDAVFSKKFGKAAITRHKKIPVATTYASFAGRLFAANAVFDGNREALGIGWSGSSGLHDDWAGLGAGYELLIDDMSVGDRIVALRSMGLDRLVILLRNSIWVGTRTGILNRPADFKAVSAGVGTINEQVTQTTRFGVMFLSSNGVYLFDGNQAHMVSAQINKELLPLGDPREYSALYDPRKARYYLFTPDTTYIYEFEHQRWLKRTFRTDEAVLFSEQFPGVTWDEVQGTWEEQEGVWEDFKPSQADEVGKLFLVEREGRMLLGLEDYTMETAFGEPVRPTWEFPLTQGSFMDQLVTTLRIGVQHRNAGNIRLYLPNIEGDYVAVADYPLSPTDDKLRIRQVSRMFTGLGVGLKVEMLMGAPKLSKFELMFIPRDQRLDHGDFATREYLIDFT